LYPLALFSVLCLWHYVFVVFVIYTGIAKEESIIITGSCSEYEIAISIMIIYLRAQREREPLLRVCCNSDEYLGFSIVTFYLNVTMYYIHTHNSKERTTNIYNMYVNYDKR
jgi:hypothetical protein